MSVAFAQARAAAARGEAPIGAAVAREGVVIASAGAERLVDCDLYVTLEPCAMCAGAISHARLRRLYFAASDAKGGAVEHGPRWFGQPTCLHAPEVYGGLRESEAGEMLKAFFARLRK